MADDKRQLGMFHKFNVERTDGKSAPGQKHYGCEYFVLDMDHDQFAAPAVQAYADACESDYPVLAADLRKWLSGERPSGFVRQPVSPLRSPGAGDLLKRWQAAALDHYTPGWAFDPTNPELMIGNIAREAHPSPGAGAMLAYYRSEIDSIIGQSAVEPGTSVEVLVWTIQQMRTSLAGIEKRASLRALPLPAREVPGPLKAWAEEFDNWCDESPITASTVSEIDNNLRAWIRKEYGL